MLAFDSGKVEKKETEAAVGMGEVIPSASAVQEGLSTAYQVLQSSP